MDAAAKRVMWRVLGGIAAGRALLITTHSMEEADALANRAGILAQRMLAIGTADELRKAHGDANNVHVVHRDAPRTSDADMQRMREWVQRNIAGATVEERTYHGQLRFSVANTPANNHATSSSSTSHAQPSSGHSIRALFDILETHKEELGIAFYSVSPTSLDQIFLNVVRKHNIAEENSHAETKAGKGSWWPFGKKEKKQTAERSVTASTESVRGSEEDEETVVEEAVVGKGSGASGA
jgi:ATP-binding cassette subfamily A (ABC1) protein 3